MEGLVKETLNIYYLIDTSASMYGERIEKLNTCMQDLIPDLQEAAIENNVKISVRVIEFGNDVAWTIGTVNQGVDIEDMVWTNVRADGEWTPTAQAIDMVADALNPEYIGNRALRPVVILITDGQCNDPKMSYPAACQKLAGKIGGNATRIAVSVVEGEERELVEFASVGKLGEKDNAPFVLHARNATDLRDIVRWASVVSIRGSVKHDNTGNNRMELSGAGMDDGWI